MHEHIFVLDPQALQNYGHVWGASYWDEETRVADAIAKLRRLKTGGIDTIVDPTVPRLGRCIPRVQRINDEVDLNIVVASGVYAFLELPDFLAYRSNDAIVELFVREIREGIDDTGVKAAFLKCAVEKHGLIGDVTRILDAIAAASLETGAPVMVHTNASAKTGLLALEALTSAGVGHDAACFYDFMVENPFFVNEKPDYLHISEKIVPRLLDAGVTQEQIDVMFVENPERFFSS